MTAASDVQLCLQVVLPFTCKDLLASKTMRAVIIQILLLTLCPGPGCFAQNARTSSNPTGTNHSVVRSLPRISKRSEFDRLSRTYYRGRFYALPHVMFVIDRQQHDRVYYINSNLFQFHKDFVNANYLSLERGRAFYENNYQSSNRRFILGTL